jgi:hypothetical protein
MNPLESEARSLEETTAEAVSVEPVPVENEIDATPVEIEPETPAEPIFLHAEEPEAEEIADPIDDIADAEQEYAPSAAPIFYESQPVYADQARNAVDEATAWDYTHADDGGFYVTVIQEKNVQQRNALLL